jgi:Ni/Co efflux regulator RcnB
MKLVTKVLAIAFLAAATAGAQAPQANQQAKTKKPAATKTVHKDTTATAASQTPYSTAKKSSSKKKRPASKTASKKDTTGAKKAEASKSTKKPPVR